VKALALSQLESSETVAYMANLEKRLAAKDDTIAEQSRQLVALRSAKEALARSLGKGDVKPARVAKSHHVMMSPVLVTEVPHSKTPPSATAVASSEPWRKQHGDVPRPHSRGANRGHASG